MKASPSRNHGHRGSPAPRSSAPGAQEARIPAGSRTRRRGGIVPRKRPTQARARETVDAILQAAVDLFAAGGHAGTTTNGIAERAGVSIGSLYQYFPNKDAILAALHERHAAAVEAAVAGSMALLADPAIPLERSLRALFDSLCAVHDASPKLTRAVSVQPSYVPRIEAALRKHEHGHESQVESLLRARPDVRRGDRTVMARLMIRVTETLTRWLAHEVPRGAEREAAADEAVRMLARYLSP